MRRIISFILIIFMFIWSYNLFINNIIDLEEAKDKPYRGVIRVLNMPTGGSHGVNNHRWLQERISSFERANPGVYIELTSLDRGIRIDDNVEEMPDIVSVDLKFSDFDILESLDEHFSKEELEEFKHQVLKPLTYEKELKAIPIAMSTYSLYLNLEKFNEKGVVAPVNGDWTYDEFVDTLKELSHPSEEDEGDEYGLMAPMGLSDYNIWGIILSDGAELINPRRLVYNFYGEKAIKGLEKAMDLRNKHKLVAEGFGILEEREAWKKFSQDQSVAVYITGSWAVKSLEKLYGDGDGFNFDTANYPIGDKGLPTVLSGDIISYGLVKGDDPQKTKACVEILKYLANESNQKSLEDIGLFTVKRGINDMYKNNIRMKKIEESLSYTAYIPFVDNWGDMESIIQGEIREAILGKKKSYEAIEDAKMRIDQMDEK